LVRFKAWDVDYYLCMNNIISFFLFVLKTKKQTKAILYLL
jgi:hypothetical protein